MSSTGTTTKRTSASKPTTSQKKPTTAPPNAAAIAKLISSVETDLLLSHKAEELVGDLKRLDGSDERAQNTITSNAAKRDEIKATLAEIPERLLPADYKPSKHTTRTPKPRVTTRAKGDGPSLGDRVSNGIDWVRARQSSDNKKPSMLGPIISGLVVAILAWLLLTYAFNLVPVNPEDPANATWQGIKGVIALMAGALLFFVVFDWRRNKAKLGHTKTSKNDLDD